MALPLALVQWCGAFGTHSVLYCMYNVTQGQEKVKVLDAKAAAG